MAYVSLTPHLEEFIQNEVKSGRYSSPSEVMREALRLLQDERQLHRDRVEERPRALDRMAAAKARVRPAAVQAAKSVEEQEREAFDEVRAMRREYAEVLDRYRNGAFELCCSPWIIGEVERALRRPRNMARYRYRSEDVDEFLDGLIGSARFFDDVPDAPAVTRDPSDDQVIAAARQIRTYTVELEPAEEGGYVATCPALPGLATQGGDALEAFVLAEDAIEARLTELLTDGQTLPPSDEPRAERVSAQVTVAAAPAR